MLVPVGVVGEVPDDVVKTRPQMMDDFSSEDAKAERNRSLEVIFNRLRDDLYVVIAENGVIARLKEPFDFGLKILDVLVGPINLLPYPSERRTIVAMSQPKSTEMRRFNNALRDVLSVSKSDLNQMLEEERRSKIGKLKPGPKPKLRLPTTRLPKRIRQPLDCQSCL